MEFYDNMFKGEAVVPVLAGTTADFKGNDHIAFTISYPTTKRFRSYDSVQQKRVYINLLKEFMKRYDQIKTVRIRYEYNKQGNVHIHGYIILPKQQYRLVCILDFVKKLNSIAGLSKQSTYLKTFDNDKGVTVQCPFVKMDYLLTSEQVDKWILYMNKDDLLIYFN